MSASDHSTISPLFVCKSVLAAEEVPFGMSISLFAFKRIRADAELSVMLELLVNATEAPRRSSEPAVPDTDACTEIAPLVETTVLNEAKCAVRSAARMVAVPEVFDTNSPRAKVPDVGPAEVMFTAEGVGATVKVSDVPTNASEVKVRVTFPLAADDNPKPAKS